MSSMEILVSTQKKSSGSSTVFGLVITYRYYRSLTEIVDRTPPRVVQTQSTVRFQPCFYLYDSVRVSVTSKWSPREETYNVKTVVDERSI